MKETPSIKDFKIPQTSFFEWKNERADLEETPSEKEFASFGLVSREGNKLVGNVIRNYYKLINPFQASVPFFVLPENLKKMKKFITVH